MRRAFVSLPDGIWKILDKDFKDKMGAGDSETIRNIVVSYLSEHGYFINQKGMGTKEDLNDKIRILETMITSLTEVLEEKGSITYPEWETRIKKKIALITKK